MTFDDFHIVYVDNQERGQLLKTLPDIEANGGVFWIPRHIDLKRLAESFAQVQWFLNACDDSILRPNQWMFLRDHFNGPNYRRNFDWNFMYPLCTTYLPFRGMDSIGNTENTVMYLDSDPMSRFTNLVPVEDSTFDGMPKLSIQAVNFNWQGIWQFYDDTKTNYWKKVFGDIVDPSPFMIANDIRELYKTAKNWDKDVYILQTNRGYAQWGRPDSPFVTSYSTDKLHRKTVDTYVNLEERTSDVTSENYGWDASNISFKQRFFQSNTNVLPSGESDPSGLYHYRYQLTDKQWSDLADDKFYFYFPIPTVRYGYTLKQRDVLFVFKVKVSKETYYTSGTSGVGRSDDNVEYEKTIVAKVSMTKGDVVENFTDSAGNSYGRCQQFYIPESTYRQVVKDILDSEGWVDVNEIELDQTKHQNVPGVIMMKQDEISVDLKGTYVCTKWHGSFDMSSWTPTA